ncbi:hypothetical protein BH11PLA1_BH11PLA1_04520 [soil metagenome]
MPSTPLRIAVAPPFAFQGDYAALDRDRNSWVRDFAGVMIQDARFQGTVLDIGCQGGAAQQAFRDVVNRAAQLDGVDPNPKVMENADLTRKWCGEFECLELPENAYDATACFQVTEHIARPREFFEQVFHVLKPGGVFYSTAPHSLHPFAAAVLLLDKTRIKYLLSAHDELINDIPTYYRMNSRRTVLRHLQGIGFASVEFFLTPCVQWDTYFPKALRFLPHIYDRVLGARVHSMSQMLMVKLEKPAA